MVTLASKELTVITVVALPPGVTLLPMLIDPQLNAPLPLILQVQSFFIDVAFRGKLTTFVTVSVTPELTTRLAVDDVLEFVAKDNDKQLAFAVTVKVAPVAIITSSPDPGTTPVDHEPVAFQSPTTELDVLVTAPASRLKPIHKAKARRETKMLFKLFIVPVVADGMVIPSNEDIRYFKIAFFIALSRIEWSNLIHLRKQTRTIIIFSESKVFRLCFLTIG